MYAFNFDSLVELNAYAIVYSYTKNGSVCDLTIPQFAELLKLKRRKTIYVLKSLEEKGFIEVERVVFNNVKRNHYKAFNPADFN